MITDDDALERQPALREFLQARAASYPEVALKLEHGCDYVVVDPMARSDCSPPARDCR